MLKMMAQTEALRRGSKTAAAAKNHRFGILKAVTAAVQGLHPALERLALAGQRRDYDWRGYRGRLRDVLSRHQNGISGRVNCLD
jgi:hypothetical protein